MEEAAGPRPPWGRRSLMAGAFLLLFAGGALGGFTWQETSRGSSAAAPLPPASPQEEARYLALQHTSYTLLAKSVAAQQRVVDLEERLASLPPASPLRRGEEATLSRRREEGERIADERRSVQEEAYGLEGAIPPPRLRSLLQEEGVRLEAKGRRQGEELIPLVGTNPLQNKEILTAQRLPREKAQYQKLFEGAYTLVAEGMWTQNLAKTLALCEDLLKAPAPLEKPSNWTYGCRTYLPATGTLLAGERPRPVGGITRSSDHTVLLDASPAGTPYLRTIFLHELAHVHADEAWNSLQKRRFAHLLGESSFAGTSYAKAPTEVFANVYPTCLGEASVSPREDAPRLCAAIAAISSSPWNPLPPSF